MNNSLPEQQVVEKRQHERGLTEGIERLIFLRKICLQLRHPKSRLFLPVDYSLPRWAAAHASHSP